MESEDIFKFGMGMILVWLSILFLYSKCVLKSPPAFVKSQVDTLFVSKDCEEASDDDSTEDDSTDAEDTSDTDDDASVVTIQSDLAGTRVR